MALKGVKRMPRPQTWCHPEKPYFAKGFCHNCYSRAKRRGHPLIGTLYTSEERQERLVESQRRSGLKKALALAEISHEQYEQALKKQGGVCAICARGPVGKSRLSIDHDHRTKKFRGLLCDLCNRAIGYLNDNAERARHLAAYLEKYEALQNDLVGDR